MTLSLSDRLRDRIRTTGGVLSVGLNPDPSRLPADCREYDYPRRAFNRRIIDATSDHAAAYTASLAAYETPDGWTALEETLAYAQAQGVPVIFDGKRAEVGAAARQHATLLDSADALTVSPYLGRESAAALSRPGRGVFVVCRTPNSGASDLQDLELADGETLAERAADLAGEWAEEAAGDVGLLVGGSADDVEALRERAPDLPFLVVGGARNDPEVAEHATADGVGLVNVSREVLYAGETAGRGREPDADAYAAAARQAAGRLKRQLRR
ncbi:orotidine-5'-phosphate decarboxylase [Halorussus salilacus]|uniref:orotidine-5'-phosphate decarboxylase n=1 Tax=Halorussus salilacus TaxID=2953750 RepID=UPI0020A1BB31|nr:orotidine-5'-phosphate decarboxylase [Halorussus salilacus]USZ67646.1 orotidine-5'-phosphate decarboxylase [Halorussus salilacus]